VQEWVEKERLFVVREFVGHGIGTKMHEEPQLPNYGKPDKARGCKREWFSAIEPMVNAGGPAVKVLSDDWTAVTADGSDSAHFEHTVAVTANGPWILTRPRESDGSLLVKRFQIRTVVIRAVSSRWGRGRVANVPLFPASSAHHRKQNSSAAPSGNVTNKSSIGIDREMKSCSAMYCISALSVGRFASMP